MTTTEKNLTKLGHQKPAPQEISTAIVIASLEKQAAPSIRRVTDLKIKTKDDFELAATLVKQLKGLSALAKQEEDTMVNPAKATIKAIQAHFKPFQNKVAEIETEVKTKMGEFLVAQKKLSAKVEQDFEDGKIRKISTIVAKQAELRVDNGTAQVRKVWKLFIDSPKEIERIYLMPDEVAIKEAFRAGGYVSGCRYEQIDSITI